MPTASSQACTTSQSSLASSSRWSTRPLTSTTASSDQALAVSWNTLGKTTTSTVPCRSSRFATSIVDPARVMTLREPCRIPPIVTLAWSCSSARSPVYAVTYSGSSSAISPRGCSVRYSPKSSFSQRPERAHVVGHLRSPLAPGDDRLDRSLAHILHRHQAESDRLGHAGRIGLDGEEGLRALHVRRPYLDPQPPALGNHRGHLLRAL